MESFNDALIECVKACGGSARVGKLLWPEKTEKDAQRSLLDALNEDRPAKLSPDQVLFLLRLSRQKGFHDGMSFLCGDIGYTKPLPLEPEDEVSELMRAFNASVEIQAQLTARIEKAVSRIKG